MKNAELKVGDVVFYTTSLNDTELIRKAIIWDKLPKDHDYEYTIKLNSGAYVLVNKSKLSHVVYDIDNMTQEDVDDLLREVSRLKQELQKDKK